MAKAGKGSGGDQDSAPKSIAGVLTLVISLAGAEYLAINTLLIEPCKANLADCRKSLDTDNAKWSEAVPKNEFQAVIKERDEIRRQLVATQAKVGKLPEVVAYLQGLEAKRAEVDKEVEQLSIRLEQVMAAAAAAQQRCAQETDRSADICRSAAQHEAAAKAIPAQLDTKRKRSDSLTEQIQETLARLGGTS